MTLLQPLNIFHFSSQLFFYVLKTAVIENNLWGSVPFLVQKTNLFAKHDNAANVSHWRDKGQVLLHPFITHDVGPDHSDVMQSHFLKNAHQHFSIYIKREFRH